MIKNHRKNIDADGLASEIYFGNYVITYQGVARLAKIVDGKQITIKSVSPAGEIIAEKVHELQQ